MLAASEQRHSIWNRNRDDADACDAWHVPELPASDGPQCQCKRFVAEGGDTGHETGDCFGPKQTSEQCPANIGVESP